MNNMSSLVDTLTASGGTESAEYSGFLNDIIAQLWPNINVAGCKMIKDIVEPIFKSTLPGPLSSLYFSKLDLGPVPMHLSRVDVHKTEKEGIKLDVDLDWNGKSDIELDGHIVPKMGIEHIKLRGRFSVLLCPLTNIIPLIGALQVAFINPPTLKLEFTDAISIAELDIIERAIKKVILNILGGMLVLPNRMLVKLDPRNDWFKTYVPHVGIIRLTISAATGIQPHKKSGAKRLLQKLVKDVPDCYCNIAVGASEAWRTKTSKDQHDPVWDETHDFLVMDHDQVISIDVNDDDLGDDDDIGEATTTTRQILLEGGTQELKLVHKGQETDARVKIHAKFYELVADADSLAPAEGGGDGGEGLFAGLATVLIASAHGLEGDHRQLNPSVRISFGSGREFNTVAKTYTEGMDIFNPAFDTAFQIPLTAADVAATDGVFKIALMDKAVEIGGCEVSFQEVKDAEGMLLEKGFDVGKGATVRASFSLRGMRLAT
ncbi:hypothetical protein F4777DRAFT_55281 [Nemania sp. FL0916]|nr:hypothetical protein F4777DRAFT_55281 [Nemania sp. FL0916]